jgi:hypothetical protein
MRSVTSSTVARPPRRRRGALRIAAALGAAIAIVPATSGAAAADCPWIVQPTASSLDLASAPPVFGIAFDGLWQTSKVFYGFTVTSLDLAWQLSNQHALPALRSDARKLEPKISPEGATAYQLASDSIEPRTIYLVAAAGVIDELEQIGARIEPARPMALSQLTPRTRGGSDWSGPLPPRSLPGVEIAGPAEPTTGAADHTGSVLADVQICAYQVSLR